MQRARRIVLPLAALAAAVVGAVAGVGADAAPSGVGDAYVRGQAAVERIGDRLPMVAVANGLRPDDLRSMLLTDATLAVDRAGNLAYFDVLAPGEVASAGTEATAAAPPLTGPEFQLASLPGAPLTIFLDFDGHTTTGTTWNTQNGIATIVSPPYDTDGNPDTWSATELAVIRDSWAVVAEDFAPWQVNVTTIDPGTDALRYSGGGDTRWGVRVVVTDDTWANCGCGGHAYIGAFDDTQDEPAFVYNSSFVGVSEAITHEVGHTLYLAHDGTTTGDAYYRGHDGIGPGWAPIMGVGYYEEVSQWSRQEYVNANNTGSSANYGQGDDDVAIISNTGLGNLPIKFDDHGSGTVTATPLPGTNATVDGVIETRGDVDAFSFSTSGGTVSLRADGAPLGPNLDISMSLRDGTGAVVASSNPVDGLDASIVATVPAGSYLVEVDGVGVGDPATNPPSGYTDYGSLGRYTLTVVIEGISPPDTTPPASPSGLTATETDGDVSLAWSANVESDLGAYVVQRDSGAGFTDLVTTGSTAFVDVAPGPGTHSYRIVAVDTTGNRSLPSPTATVDVPVVLVSHATSETSVAGTVTGSYTATHSIGGAAQTITEIESGGKPANRHDLLEHVWQLPATSGGHTLTIHASTNDGGDADAGVLFEVSADGTSWMPIVVVPPNESIAAPFDIGQQRGTVFVRVVDTDRTRAERSFDSVTVDFLELTGDGIVVQDPDPTSVAASIVLSQVSVGKGSTSGAATVTVVDDLGKPVADAGVTVQFAGDFVDTLTGTTGADGRVTLVTNGAARKPSFSACVQSVDTDLPYTAGTEAC